MLNLQSTKRRYNIIGRSEALERALTTALRVAPTDLSILITGESGVGKEVFSRIIHDNSTRKHEGFIAINCGALPEGTINSELFGHVKGAFTSATGDRKGYFETYDGGTIFLDEIGEMPLDTQSFLLRVLESGEFIRVGSSKVQTTNVRVVAATNRKLMERVRDGKFREDLYYRLATVPIELPALRERREDIHLLFRFFANDFAEKQGIEPIRLDDEARLILEAYHWPGNIRELKNVAEQLTILAEERELSAGQLSSMMPRLLQRNLPALTSSSGDGPGQFQGMNERELLYKVLFDMKKDLNDLKSLLYEIISSNDLRVPDPSSIRALGPGLTDLIDDYEDRRQAGYFNDRELRRNETYAGRRLPSERGGGLPYTRESAAGTDAYPSQNSEPSIPIIVDNRQHEAYDESTIVEENLSLMANEEALIKKALKKHDGKRKEAAAELGISERTLYRKIKEYDL
ncbi:MAG: sigma 54-interacting transcriptional regulator [Bacteroidota bacterium]